MLDYNVLSIPNTLNVVTKCWEKAETELGKVVKCKYHDLDEELITKLFYGEFAYTLDEASQRKDIERAFLSDLRTRFPQSGGSQLNSISANLVASVSLHKRGTEKITGGDFGLTITRPRVARHSETELVIDEYNRGLICQAKLKRRNGKWGKLTNRQRDVFPSRTSYLGLLLYSYSDTERCNLDPFHWQLCQEATVDGIEQWLKSGKFPSAQKSADIIRRLGNGHIGTDKHEIIEQVIRPNKPHLHIRVFWPSDRRPPERVRFHVAHHTRQVVKVRG